MKKKKKGCFAAAGFMMIFVFVIASFLMVLLFSNHDLLKKLPFDTKSIVLERLTDYKPLVEDELDEQGLSNYTSLILGMMYQESKGKGSDPMQSSESLGLKRNEIQDPQLSIKQGIKQFTLMYKTGKDKGVDLETIIQSYNMGAGYIDFVAEHGGTHTEELAKQYSEQQVEKNPELYTCGGNKNNFRYPYCYGDYTYAEKVKEKTKTVEESLNVTTLETLE
ncbi:lysozyme family protein [Bacillus atrophaeus]|uniref:lysozyme family protein n=1 Tax=Bacillus atrophaeus TaxID=1452 RepID=UPI00123B7233|nr:lysozyme family protein [Bacillus atrophaeus]KAA6450210.1 lysozyme family protein [Bacillus atrophaeus]